MYGDAWTDSGALVPWIALGLPFKLAAGLNPIEVAVDRCSARPLNDKPGVLSWRGQHPQNRARPSEGNQTRVGGVFRSGIRP